MLFRLPNPGYNNCTGAPLMNRTNTTAETLSAGSEPRKTGAKKEYKAPAYRFEKVFEVTALACGKIGPTQASCRFNRKVS